MPASTMQVVSIAVVAFCFVDLAFGAGDGRFQETQTPIQAEAASSRSASAAILQKISWKQRAPRRLRAARDPYADPAVPYKANRLSSQPGRRIINIPSQTTVITRQVIDDKNATTLRDVLRTTPGVTIGR